LTKRRRWTSCFNKEFWWWWWLMEKCEKLNDDTCWNVEEI